jgi:raffinose/stachyose/melibiose transport system substrate-binding protein
MKQLSRRNFLKTTAGAAGAALLSSGPFALNIIKAQGDYQGKFVIMSAGNAEQNAGLIEGIQTQFPGIEVEWRGLTSERYVELFTASEVAGDQIDIMDLNGQDLRRYAVGGRMKDLSSLSYLDRFRPIGLETYTIQGTLWALPNGGISGFPFFVNRKALDAIGFEGDPESYQQLLDIAPDLKAAGYAPFVHSGQNIYLWPIWQFWGYAQTSANNAVEGTYSVLAGDTKFTDPEHVAALEFLYRYAQDGMFIDSVNSLDVPATQLAFAEGKGAFWYHHSSFVGAYRDGDFPNLDLSFIQPLRSVDDPNVMRQLPGGTGAATGIYAKVAPEREEIALAILDFMTSDEMVALRNEGSADAVSTNANVSPSDDPLALRYAEIGSPAQITYLDWYWPPEITRAFQEHQQALVAGTETPDVAAQGIQDAMDELYADGYEFVS